MTDCPRFGKLFGGCKFESRYDASAHGPEADAIAAALERIVFGSDQTEALAQLRSDDKTYIRDICIRCGKTVERAK